MAEGLVRRRRLFDLLSTTPRVRVVAAPSGFGKTTLLRSWVDALPAGERVLVWVALSAEVATRQDFWQLVVASAARGGHLGADAHKALTSEIEALDDPVPTIARRLGDCGRVLLVLDAYEHLRGLTDDIDDDILRLTAEAAGLDSGLEVVVTTRAATRLCDEVLVLRGRVRVLGEADLRFTTEEVARLLEMHAPHAVDAAERIVGDTLGYPLGVRAVAHALQRLGSTPSFDSVAWQRLVTEDLRSQIADPTLVDFVLDTSVPPYFDRDLARELTGAEVDRALAELAWNGFGRWIPYARERPVFQYVESVRDVFLAQVRADQPARYERAAGLAAAWLHRHADHDLALGLAIEARQFELASSICRSLVISNPDVYATDAFVRHLRRVPVQLLPRYPVLAFISGMAHTTNPATRGSAAEYFRIAAEHALDHTDRLTPREAFFHHVGREVCFRYLGRNKEAGAAAVAGLAYLDSMSAADRDELSEFLPMALSILAYSLFQIGDIERASVLVDRAAASAEAPWWRAYAGAFAAGLHALNGRATNARAALAMADIDAWGPDHPRRIPHLLGVVGRATLRLDEFDFTGAQAELDGVATFIDAAESWPFISWTLMHVRLGLGESGAEALQVEQALASKPPPLGLGPNLATAAMLNALAILWLADGRAAKGRPLLRADGAYSGQLAPAQLLYHLATGKPAHAVRSVASLLARPGHTVRSTAAVETLGAAAALRAGNDQTALALLERAAARYRRFGVRAHLMYVPATDLHELGELARASHRSVCETYLASPLVAPIGEVHADPVLLTPRELEVLRLWAKHRTRAEVANELFVSANTVKSQLNSAYRKLGVTTKDAAIQRAIELDLLHRPVC